MPVHYGSMRKYVIKEILRLIIRYLNFCNSLIIIVWIGICISLIIQISYLFMDYVMNEYAE